jgi:AraC-like DNA-binding protein
MTFACFVLKGARPGAVEASPEVLAYSSKPLNITAMAVELSSALLAWAKGPGLWPTAHPALSISRADAVEPRLYSLHRPSCCFVVQGQKQVCVGSTLFRYRAGEFLFSCVDLPMTGAILEASPRRPYLCLVLAIDASLVFELSALVPGEPAPTGSARAIFVGQSDAQISDAFSRLTRCLATPTDVEVLAPGIIREITYRLLSGPYRDAVRAVGVAGSQTQRIARVIERLKRDYDKELTTAELAGIAGMSVSSFHQHFKQVTTLSPLQYQKQLRLQEARRLLLSQNANAAEVGFRVGYESPSQFSREYARLFGAPPISDVKRVRGATNAGSR